MKLRGVMAYVLPSLGNILWIAVFVGVISLGPRMMNVDGDLGRHLTVGQYILNTGQIPIHDLFSHTMTGQPLTPHEWLSQVLFALADRLMGLNGVVLLVGLVIALTFWLVYRRALAHSRHVLIAVGMVILAVAASSLHWLTRPHVFTFLMMALWIDALERLRVGYLREWWRMPLMMALWANLHGAFVAGLVTWVIYGVGMAWDQYWKREGQVEVKGFWRAYLLAGGISFLATLLTPSGFSLWGTSLGYIGNAYLVGHTAEYLSPDFHMVAAWPFLIMLALMIVLLGLQVRKPPAAQIFLCGAWAAMGLYSVRNVPLFAIIAAPMLASLGAQWFCEHATRSGVLARWEQMEQNLIGIETLLKGIVWPAVMAVLVTLAFLSGSALDFNHTGNQFDPKVFPVSAVNWMQVHPVAGKGFNYFTWGGYLLYRLWPEQTVFIDGQTDFYGESLTRQYEQVLTLAPGWETVLKQYDVAWVLMPPDEPLSRRLAEIPGWKAVYQDSTAVLWELSGP